VTYVDSALLIVAAMQTAAIAALLIRGRRRRREERALHESEERFRLLADRAPVIIWTVRPNGTLDYINGTAAAFTGLPIEKLLENGWLDAVHPADLDLVFGISIPAFKARTPFVMDYRIRGADSAYRWLLDMGVPKYGADGSFAGYIGCSIDITERKNAEDQIRASRAELEVSHREIQHLAGRLIEAQDAERARVARDLHDDVSQQLAGLSIAFSALRHRMEELHTSPELHADLRSLHERTTALAQNVRHLSHDLHPTVLRHAGLVPALASYCAEVERSHGTASRCSAEGEFASIAPETALCLYRIAQEALRNVIAHAGAKQVDVRLLRSGDSVEFTIADDGRGFDVAGALKRGEGLGLVSITERVRLAKGIVSIVSEPGKGTCVRVRIPGKNMSVKSGAGAATEEVARA
jgi:PAS domain S-box-containing protein